jgi:hypothetical protein
MTNRVRGWVSVLAAAALLCSTGCFGSYALVRRVHRFNGEVHSQKWVQEGVFLGLNFPFVPVYGIACLLDTLFFNSVEFWTGETLIPIESKTAAKAQPPAPAPTPAQAPAPAKPASKKSRAK